MAPPLPSLLGRTLVAFAENAAAFTTGDARPAFRLPLWADASVLPDHPLDA